MFRTFSAFNSHIYRHHRCEMCVSQVGEGHPFVIDPLSDSSSLNNVTIASREHEIITDPVTESETTCLISYTSSPLPNLQESGSQHSGNLSRTVSAAKMLLELREGHQVSQVAIADVVTNCRLLCNHAVDYFKSHVVTALNASGQDSEDIQLALQEEYDPFKDIDTNYRFEKFCVDHLGCLVSAIVYQCTSIS